MNLQKAADLLIERHQFEINKMYDEKLIVVNNLEIKATNSDVKEYLEYLFDEKKVEEVLTKGLIKHIWEITHPNKKHPF